MALYVKEENCLEMDVRGRWESKLRLFEAHKQLIGKRAVSNGRVAVSVQTWKSLEVWCWSARWIMSLCFSAVTYCVCQSYKCAGDDAAAAIQVSVGEPTNVSDVASSAVSAASLPTASSSFRSQSTSFAVLVLCCQFAIVNRHIFHQRWLHSNGGK